MAEGNGHIGNNIAERSVELGALDRAHQVHPQQLDADQAQPVVYARGQGSVL